MEMGCGKDEAEFPALLGEGTEKGYGVSSAREADGQTQAGLKESEIERQTGRHEPIIRGEKRRTSALVAQRKSCAFKAVT
jgi:hypothetical protein